LITNILFVYCGRLVIRTKFPVSQKRQEKHRHFRCRKVTAATQHNNNNDQIFWPFWSASVTANQENFGRISHPRNQVCETILCEKDDTGHTGIQRNEKNE
jgi:hypothetical protein